MLSTFSYLNFLIFVYESEQYTSNSLIEGCELYHSTIVILMY
jgi:hypothetical protein